MPYADVNGQRLYYEDTSSGPPVVFSHGLFMDRAMFDPQVLALRDRYRCITWDERGHGNTGDATEAFTYWDSADDLRALLHSIGIERAVLVGMSQGGFLSLRAALRYPELVRGLILIDTQAGTENPEALPYYEQLLARWNAQGADDELLGIIANLILGAGWDGTPEWTAKWQKLDPANVNVLFATLAGREDITDRLPEIQAPAVVIHGEQDLSIPVPAAQALADGLAHASLVIVPEAGHASNLTHPDAVTPVIEAFLDRLGP
jgi:pimeloyl-ACP methyl ester carboxylesterase